MILLSIVLVIIIIVCVVVISNINNGKSSQKIEEFKYSTQDDSQDIYDLVYSGTEVTKITDLPVNYKLDDVTKDGAYAFFMGNKYNEDACQKFLEKYYAKEDAFLRVGKVTVEGDLCIYDIKYVKEKDSVYIIRDNTRDSYLSSEYKKITFWNYEKIGEYEEEGKKYLVAYNGQINVTNPAEDFVMITVLDNNE